MHVPSTELLIPRAGMALAPAASNASSRPGLLKRAGLRLWRGLEAVGQARARRELCLLADCWAHSDPDLARQLRAASAFDALQDASKTASEPARATSAGQPVAGR